MLVLAIKQFTQTQEYPVHLVGGNEMEAQDQNNPEDENYFSLLDMFVCTR